MTKVSGCGVEESGARGAKGEITEVNTFSLHPLNGKRPRLREWNKRATRDLRQIARWREMFPRCNMGVVADAEFCILESDDLLRLQSLLCAPLPRTLTVQASENRPHFYFRQTQDTVTLGNCDLPGVFEFKQHDRYVVGAGSIHPTSGLEYR